MFGPTKINALFVQTRENKWHWLFYWFCRLSLALGFFIAGMVKIMDERFANGLSEIHPMGAYLVALFHTGYYYTFIGIAQVLAAALLLFNRTALLGALLYFPIIVNIWILSLALRFDGSYISSTWMVFANIYLLAYHFDRLQFLWIKKSEIPKTSLLLTKPTSWKFPFRFALMSLTLMSLPMVIFLKGYEVLPRNSLEACKAQFQGSIEAPEQNFCLCVHQEGLPLNSCLEKYEQQKFNP
ncbi:DoxX family protein [Algoriphagus namhaensis]|uniref:DoxX family protein n=1 Tax=Algoriphagus namhaensis TaxID=915353 RepID=A0ABV8AY58_9BACT